jgi:ATP synthase in type III secretion protein N
VTADTATTATTEFAELSQRLATLRTVAERGRVVQAWGTTLRATGLSARIGQQCLVRSPGAAPLRAEVVGLSQGEVILVPLAGLQNVASDAQVELLPQAAMVPFGHALLGRVIDAFGQPLDGKPLPPGLNSSPVYREPPNPLLRATISQPLCTGVRAIDAALTVGVGQRVGVFASAGGGKSTLSGMLARTASSDVNVIALIGERGREVREFLEDSLGPVGLKRSVVVVATAERPAMERLRAAHAATAIAEGFRDEGASVMLLMDSVTRFARALREIGLAIGEPAVRRGFPPSVFAEMPRLFERAGNDQHGSITAFYTVLSEDEDGMDPVSEEVRSLLDGHIVLSRDLARSGHYPAIDVLASASRVFERVAGAEQRQCAMRLRALMAKHAEIRFLLQVGEYRAGSDELADQAIERWPALQTFLRQRPDEATPLAQTLSRLAQVVS